MKKYIIISCIIWGFINFTDAQVKIVKVKVYQDKTLSIFAGDDILKLNQDSILIGDKIQITGGSPEFSFQWTEPGGNILNGQKHYVKLTGKYILNIIDANNCSASNSLDITSSNGVINIQDKPLCNIVLVNSSNLKVHFLENRKNIKITAISISGQDVYTKMLNNVIPESTYTINLVNKKGVFFIRVTDGSSHTIKKIIIH